MKVRSQHSKTRAAATVTICTGVALCLVRGAHNLSAAGRGSDAQQVTEPREVASAAAAGVHLERPAIHTRPIEVNVHMVVVGVTVVDSGGRIITGLNKNNFRVYDERVSQEIASFSCEDAPASVGMVFDASGSMSNKIARSKEALFQFFKTSNPDDEFMLIDFADRPGLLSSFTSNIEALQGILASLETGGRTSMLDAIYLGLNEMKRAHSNRKALVVISDGVDNNSRYSERDIERAVRESDTQIYAIGILEPTMFRWLPGEKSGPALLSRLANLTGGNMFPASSASQLPAIAKEISLELRNQYTIAYKPSNLIRDGSWRHISMEVVLPNSQSRLRVYNRAGYYAPTQ